jgi:hypothetical protein
LTGCQEDGQKSQAKDSGKSDPSNRFQDVLSMPKIRKGLVSGLLANVLLKLF